MRLVEQHRIDRHDSRFVLIDTAAFASKNLYNAALYHTRQAFIFRGQPIRYEALARQMQAHDAYRVLPAKVAQWVLKQVCAAWQSYFAALNAWNSDPSRFLGRPRLPKYLAKLGRNVLTYTLQAISRKLLRQGIVQPSGLADVNGSYNIGRKAAPNAFGPGGRGWVVQPVPLVLPNRQHQRTNPALVS